MPETKIAALAVLVAAALLAGCAEPPPPPPAMGRLDLATRIQQGEPPLILDVRTAAEFESGHVPGAINVPHDELGDRAAELSAYRRADVVIYGEDDDRAARAAAILHGEGFERVFRLEGDFAAWRAKGMPIAGGG